MKLRTAVAAAVLLALAPAQALAWGSTGHRMVGVLATESLPADLPAFLRKAAHGAVIVFVINATPVVRRDYRIGVPHPGWYGEVLNTDAQTYGGSNVGNYGGRQADPQPWQGKPNSILLTLPPLAVVGLKWSPPPASEPEPIAIEAETLPLENPEEGIRKLSNFKIAT